MAVVIDSGPVTAMARVGDLAPEQWWKLVAARRRFCAVNLRYDCRELLRFVDESEVMLKSLGYADTTDFIQRGLELDPKLVRWAIAGLKRLEPDEAIPFRRAVKYGKDGAPKGNQNARKNKDKNNGYNITVVSRQLRGTGRDYIMGRLQHDGHAELLAEVYAGEKSARAAGIAAGYFKKTTPLEQLNHWWKKASRSERAAFLKATRKRTP